MNAANLAKSKRLQAVFKALQTGPKTTSQLARIFDDMAIHSTVAEIRAQGHKILCSLREVTDEGRRVYLYRLMKGTK